jgi:hypothetical protein
MFTRIGLFLPAFLLLAALPAAAQAPDPTGKWEGRWRSEVRHYVEGEGAPKQLFHKGAVEARFEFCVGNDRAIVGAGRARVTRNGSVKLERMEADGDWERCSYTFEPTTADVSLKVIGQLRGADFWLFLSPELVEFRVDGTCTQGPRPFTSSALQSTPTPATGVLVASPGNPLFHGITIEARDGADQQTEGFDNYPSGWSVVPGIAEYRNRVQIRRPKDAADELPILLGQLFPSLSHSAEPPAQLYPSGERKLESILPDLKAALDGTSSKLRCGRPKVTAVIGKRPDDDDLFLEALSRARRDALKNWFAERGIDTSQVDWETAFGAEDDVQVKFGN